jgi:hypothetical protein
MSRTALGISIPTLRKHYFRELKREALGAQAAQGDAAVSLADEEANAGNATSIDKLFKRIDKLELGELEARSQPRRKRAKPEGQEGTAARGRRRDRR